MKLYRLFLFLGLIWLVVACKKQRGILHYDDNGHLQSWEYHYPQGSDFYLKKIEYYPNGQKKSEGNFNVIHNREGLWKFWYENGNIWVIGYFTNGLADGKADVFASNGKRLYTAHYAKGKPHGLWMFYDDNNTVIKKVWFDRGKKIKEIDLNH